MSDDDDRSEVLTSLPRSRPQRRSTKRAGAAEPAPADAQTTARKPRAAAKPRATAKPKAAPKPRAKAKPKPKPKAATAAKARPQAAPPPPPTSEPVSAPVEPPSRGDIVQSAVQAVGEIAQVGVTVGREAVKSVIRRLPKP
jgi:hypothetical protein